MMPAKQLDSLSRNTQQAVGCADAVLDQTQQLVNRQLDETQQALKQHSDRLRDLWSRVDPSGAMQDGLTMAEEGAHGGVELTRAYLNTVTRLQREFAHILEWQGNSSGERWREAGAQRPGSPQMGRRKAA